MLENVKNLIKHDKGVTFKIICDTLKKELANAKKNLLGRLLGMD